MKKHLPWLLAIALIGCASPKQTGLKTLRALIKEVDIAENAWTSYVVDQEIALKKQNASTADLLRQQGQINMLDVKYRAAATAAVKLAIATYDTTDIPAVGEVVDAAAAVTTTIQTFKH